MRQMDLHTALRSALDYISPRPVVASFSWLKWDNGARSGRIDVRASALVPQPDEHAYPGVTLMREVIRGQELADAILARVRQTMGTVSGHYARRTVASGNVAWPSVHFRLSLQEAIRGEMATERPLLAFGAPPNAHAGQALEAWTGGSRDSGSCDIYVEDPRGRIEAVELTNDGHLSVRLAGDVGGPQRVELQAAFLNSRRLQIGAATTQHLDQTIEIIVPPAADSVRLFLVAQDDELLAEDDVDLPARGGAKPERVEQAVDDIRRGEGEYVELKPWIEDDSPKKKIEIVRSLVALANGRDVGRLYIGVDDEGVPQGLSAIRKAHPAWAHGTPEEVRVRTIEFYRSWLRKLMDQRIRNSPGLDATLVEVADEPVLSVQVTPVTHGVCATLEHSDVWVRRGASVRRPDEERLRELLDRGSRRIWPPDMLG